jgi:hypothetical protein
MKYQERKTESGFEPVSQNDYQQKVRTDAYMARLPVGAVVEREVKRIQRHNTQAQRAAFFGLMVQIVLDDCEERGIDLSTFFHTDELPPGLPVEEHHVKAYLYACCGDVGPDGQHKTISKMDVSEMSRFFDKSRTVLAGKKGIVIPDPQPRWLREAQERP